MREIDRERQRERDRERERQRERQRQRETETECERDRQRERDRDRERQRKRQRDRERDRDRERHRQRQGETQRERNRQRQRETETGRDRDRVRERERYIETQLVRVNLEESFNVLSETKYPGIHQCLKLISGGNTILKRRVYLETVRKLQVFANAERGVYCKQFSSPPSWKRSLCMRIFLSLAERSLWVCCF